MPDIIKILPDRAQGRITERARLGVVVADDPEILGRAHALLVHRRHESQGVFIILFVDLRGFTALSETLAPPELLALLNRYLDRMSAEIERQGGVIDKYIGDEIMALFGAPVDVPDGADRAVRAALGMREALATLNREFAAEGRPPLAFGVGINTATVVAGNIGSHRRLNYSVIGDGVNLAARLQPLTRRPEYATDIIISDLTRHRLTPDTYRLRLLGEVPVKGKTLAPRIHAVDGLA
jgi:adenylate cyclase